MATAAVSLSRVPRPVTPKGSVSQPSYPSAESFILYTPSWVAFPEPAPEEVGRQHAYNAERSITT